MSNKQTLLFSFSIIAILFFSSCQPNYFKRIQGKWVYDAEFYETERASLDTLIFLPDSTLINTYYNNPDCTISTYFFIGDTLCQDFNGRSPVGDVITLEFKKNYYKGTFRVEPLSPRDYLVLRKVADE